ncbi:hypothetical protein CLAFUW4_05438 [Fulvia fulva]|uniref:Ankyrin repeat protein n=1 Tax=Passalora fulva TaxID=5499 RepID=A0A9Q8LGU5_PASFU|nr:uncharacterized protein CLAFUR5_05583 [Fulvia fulva]KAK4624049.1 hypothetical protein CLAFUR4_05432 [Fulvia fulva]KAK4625201.1 hypothetical protein CLAFUR0_05440 [Fulvia fulva]UJO17197.1 hypothetical protein CLAFUR5_05583 [Fulvia fulva]WPV15263.1 hypothetical protein CLAFUW4_05438 [Fulvia fulva]WPV29411.1 hypothetical protein CLAFUW7_05436 [Fulvia fulva]
MIDLLEELADLYRMLGDLVWAEECSPAHLREQTARLGRSHEATLKSLARLLEILGRQVMYDEAEHEIFTFVRDASDRTAVLAAMSGDQLSFLESAFLRPPEAGNAVPPTWDALSITQPPTSNTTLTAFIVPGHSLQKFTPQAPREGVHDLHQQAPGLHGQIRAQMGRRERDLRDAAGNEPDLVTLFEVMATGSTALISDYSRYIDADTTRFRDPVNARTILHYAAAFGEPHVVQKCIDVDPSLVNARDIFGATPLHLADVNGRSKSFRALVAAQSAVNLRSNTGMTAIGYARQRMYLTASMDKEEGGPRYAKPSRQSS